MKIICFFPLSGWLTSWKVCCPYLTLSHVNLLLNCSCMMYGLVVYGLPISYIWCHIHAWDQSHVFVMRVDDPFFIHSFICTSVIIMTIKVPDKQQYFKIQTCQRKHQWKLKFKDEGNLSIFLVESAFMPWSY